MADKLIHAPLPTVAIVVVCAWFGALTWLFIQDNAAGHLDTISGLWIFGRKALAYSGIALVAGLVLLLIAWLRERT